MTAVLILFPHCLHHQVCLCGGSLWAREKAGVGGGEVCLRSCSPFMSYPNLIDEFFVVLMFCIKLILFPLIEVCFLPVAVSSHLPLHYPLQGPLSSSFVVFFWSCRTSVASRVLKGNNTINFSCWFPRLTLFLFMIIFLQDGISLSLHPFVLGLPDLRKP